MIYIQASNLKNINVIDSFDVLFFNLKKILLLIQNLSKMNQSSLFSFEESSVWDPKVIRKCLVVSPDQMIKLDSFPGWAKVENDQDTLRLDKEFSIESSQFECPVNVVQNSQRIEKSRELFNEQIENRKAVLKAYKVYENKLARSLSLFTISESCKNLFNHKALKRASSFHNLQFSNASNINNNLRDFRCENFSERQFAPGTCNRNILSNEPTGLAKSSSECEISHSESGKRDELYLNKEISPRTMEIASQMTVIVPIAIEDTSLHFEAVKVSNTKQLNLQKSDKPAVASLSDQLTKEVGITESESTDISQTSEKNKEAVPVENVKTGLNTESVNTDLPKENNGTFPIANSASCSNDVTVKLSKAINSDKNSVHDLVHTYDSNIPHLSIEEVPRNVISPSTLLTDSHDVLNKVATSSRSFSSICDETQIPVSRESCESNSTSVKEIPANVVSVCENPTLHLNAQDQEKNLSCNMCNTNKMVLDEDIDSDMVSVEKIALKHDAMTSAKSDNLNLPETCPSKSQALGSPAKAFDISQKETVLETEKLVENCGSDLKEVKLEREQKEDENKTFHRIENYGSDKEVKLGSEQKEDENKASQLVENCGSGMNEVKLEREQKEGENKTSQPLKSSADNEASSGDNQVSSSKKRKLESRNKRSKRLKSEDKQSNIKIRSIKKVGEICYSVEEVKTMLDIMKQFL